MVVRIRQGIMILVVGTLLLTGGDRPQVVQAQAGFGAPGGLGGGPQSVRVEPTPEDALVRVITRMIQPDSWDEVGGAGSIELLKDWGLLVVSQTQGTHESIHMLLSRLADARRSQGVPVPQSPLKSWVAASDKELAKSDSIEKALDQEVGADFVETPLSECMAYLSQTVDIPIVLDVRAMDDIGLGGDTPVTRQLSGISLRSLLKIVLNDLELTYTVRNEVLMITTREAEESQLITYVYDVSHLLAERKSLENAVLTEQ